MGRDKALLPFTAGTLAQHVAAAVAGAAGSATLVGDPGRYSALGYAVIPDRLPGCGPLGGIHAALAATAAEWNLIVACDMPGVSALPLVRLIAAARASPADAVLAAAPGGRAEPLCAMYRAACLPAVQAALERGVRRVREGLSDVAVEVLPMNEPMLFTNCNTPEEWSAWPEQIRRAGE